MKKILFLFPLLMLVAGVMASRPEVAVVQEETTAEPDSTVAVIGYFCKNDTLDYWINESSWKFRDEDTIKTAGVAQKVRIVVTDSTAKGYKMEYTFLECLGDSSIESRLGAFQNKIVERLGQKVMGTTIKFETDEYGEITKFSNLSQIKKQAKSLYKECMKELVELEDIKGLKEMGLDLKELIDKNVDTNELVEGYVEELKLLLLCHGSIYKIGEQTTHEDATVEQYENDTYTVVSLDTMDYTYHISTDVVSKVPQSVVKSIVSELAGMFTPEEARDSINKEIDAALSEDATVDSYYGIDYMSQGWPYRVVKQTSSVMGNAGKLEQTYIWLDFYSLGNWDRNPSRKTGK